MANARGARPRRFSDAVAARNVGVEFTIPFDCSVCGDALPASTSQVAVVHIPEGRTEAWCLPCWVCLLLHAKQALADCDHTA